MVVSHLPFGPTAYFGIVNTVLRHDIKDKAVLGKMKEVAPHLILDNFTTSLGERTANILKHLFPMPKDASKRVITFANQKDYISFRCGLSACRPRNGLGKSKSYGMSVWRGWCSRDGGSTARFRFTRVCEVGS